MNKEFIPYEQAVAIKEIGFDEPCFGFYQVVKNDIETHAYFIEMISVTRNVLRYDDCVSPIKQQAFRWFRDKHNLFACIDLQCCTPSHWYIRIDNIVENDYLFHSEDSGLKWFTYEEAEAFAIEKLIEIVKEKLKQ